MEHLARLLLDFGSAPGNYLVRLREPRALFDEFDVIAQWALDRLPESLHDRAADLKAAAVLFIQRACFAPDNTYYQVLGLRPQAYPPDELRARYRTMIRLAHPDMGVKGLPANAASLVNRANAVLSDAAQRRLYDEQLARQAATKVAPSTPLRPNAHMVERHHGMAERFRMFKAQHPNVLQRGLMTAGLAALVVSVLIWAAQDSNDSRMLIVAAGRPSLAPAPSQAERATTAPQSTELVTREAIKLGTIATPIQPTQPAAWGPAPVQSALDTDASSGPAIPQTRVHNAAQSVSSVREAMGAPPLDVANTTPPVVQPVRVDAPLAAPAPAHKAAAAPAPAPAAVSPVPPPVPTSVIAAAAPVPTAAVVPQVAAPPAAAQQPAPPAWNVDAPGAMMYLTELVSKLENPSEARRVNAYLKSMKVKGSLLAPALRTLSDRPDLQVRPSQWIESTKPGVLSVQGTVLAQPRAPETADARTLRFRVVAEFHGTAEGTMLAVLDFKEGD